MPRCILKKLTDLRSTSGARVDAYSHGILLRYNDRWEVLDPANDNTLIAGMTTSFKDWLIAKGYLTILE